MRLIILFYLLFTFFISANEQRDLPFTEPIAQDFVFSNKNGEYGKYLTLDLEYSPAKTLYDLLKQDYPKLKTRFEAHITILTPPEYNAYFKSAGLSISDLKEYLRSFDSRNIEYKSLCLGSAVKGNNQTFFVIVESSDLVHIREALSELLPPKKQMQFLKRNYYPHITIGFIGRDLHISDGVIKDELHSKDARYNLVID